MSSLRDALEAGAFGVTAEMGPPKGCDFSAQLAVAERLRGHVHALNVTDMQSACLRASSLGLCIALRQAGLDCIIQTTGRDRSRMAIMADMLAAAAFGIDTMLATTGDHPMVGDCKASKPVYDLDSVGILRMLSAMEATGRDCGGNPLERTPRFYKGAVVSPMYEPLALQINKLRQKVDAGAEYIQTQALFDMEALNRFMDAVDRAGIRAHIMVGIIPLKSARMARYMNEHVPGIAVPQPMIDRLDAAADEGRTRGVKDLPAKLGIEMAAEMIASVHGQGACDGVHIMTIGAEDVVPLILEKAGIAIQAEAVALMTVCTKGGR